MPVELLRLRSEVVVRRTVAGRSQRSSSIELSDLPIVEAGLEARDAGAAATSVGGWLCLLDRPDPPRETSSPM